MIAKCIQITLYILKWINGPWAGFKAEMPDDAMTKMDTTDWSVSGGEINMELTINKTTIQSTPYGPVAAIWRMSDTGARIIRVVLSNPLVSAIERVSALYPAAREYSCKEISAVATGIRWLLEGEPVDFDPGIADFGMCTEFRERILRAEHAIPRGCVSTYKLIAAHIGLPNGARAAGNALANNPFPLIIPCHRAIRSDRGLGGYQGGPAMKRSLLKNEGIIFDGSGRVQCSRFHYS